MKKLLLFVLIIVCCFCLIGCKVVNDLEFVSASIYFRNIFYKDTKKPIYANLIYTANESTKDYIVIALDESDGIKAINLKIYYDGKRQKEIERQHIEDMKITSSAYLNLDENCKTFKVVFKTEDKRTISYKLNVKKYLEIANAKLDEMIEQGEDYSYA